MCWISSNKSILKKIAEEDIPVFKIMNLEGYQLRSFYYRFRYTKGEVYHQPIGKIIKDIWGRYNINDGFHSYSHDCKIHRMPLGELERIVVLSPNKYEKLEVILPAEKENVKVNCIIPKGSEYYLSENGTYVSNQIKIISIKYVLENLRNTDKASSRERYTCVQNNEY